MVTSLQTALRRCSAKYFLQNSQENTCAGVLFLITFQEENFSKLKENICAGVLPLIKFQAGKIRKIHKETPVSKSRF